MKSLLKQVRAFGAPALLLAVAMAIPQASYAALLVKGAPTISIPQPTSTLTGSFELFLQGTGTDIGDQISGDQLNLFLPSQANVKFTADSVSTVRPYIFAGSTSGGGSLSDNLVYFTDVPVSTNPTVPDGSGANPQTLGLLVVNYSIAANTPVGVYPITFDVNDPNSDALATFLLDQNSNFLPFTATNGSITITVPEPSALALGLLAIVGLVGFRRLRTRKA